ncbi:rCG33879 [Rattus norvegicus]|uniref:RCG33879 n=2 Tax=Rattus TaxID=10114 RepID=A6HIX7_RAT|nr:rCG33879 [Rattus norvegicus]
MTKISNSKAEQRVPF